MAPNFSSAAILTFLTLTFAFAFNLFPLSHGQVLSKLAKHHKDQEKACQEFESCMTKLAQTKNSVQSAIKRIDLGSNVEGLQMNQFLCAYKSNCKRERQAVCKPHDGLNGTIEMKVACKLLWVSGEEETDIEDPIALTFCDGEEDQQVACSNYDKCMALPTKKFKTLAILPHVEAVSHLIALGKQVLCAVRTNCMKVLKFLCDKERTEDKDHMMGKIVAVTCAIGLEEGAQNSIGSRSLGGSGSASGIGGGKAVEILSEFCHSTKDGVCSLD